MYNPAMLNSFPARVSPLQSPVVDVDRTAWRSLGVVLKDCVHSIGLAADWRNAPAAFEHHEPGLTLIVGRLRCAGAL